MDGQLEALVALDDWYIGLQRIRDVVAAADTYSLGAFQESIRPLWREAHDAQTRLRSAFSTIEGEARKAKKFPKVEDDGGCVVGWQETLNNGKRAARVSVIGDAITIALVDTETSAAQREVRLCSSCESVVEKCPRCGGEARPAPVRVGGDAWTEFCCVTCNFRFPDNGRNGLCAQCLHDQSSEHER